MSNSKPIVTISLFVFKFSQICYSMKSGIFQTQGGFDSWLQIPGTSSGYLERKISGKEDSELKENLILNDQGRRYNSKDI